jgi:hypothetical protein
VRRRAVALKNSCPALEARALVLAFINEGQRAMKRNIYGAIYANTVVQGGKIVIVGFDYAATEFRVARYNPDGTRDTTFPETKQ